MSTEKKNEVAIIGMGCTHFGELQSESWMDLAGQAFLEAVEDAGIEKKDVDGCWFNTHCEGNNSANRQIYPGKALQLSNASVTDTASFYAGVTEVFHNACYAVASGACNIALALGGGKRKVTGYGDLKDIPLRRANHIMFANAGTLDQFAVMANDYFARYGLSAEDGRRVLARISFKSHRNGALNPKAYLRDEVSIEEIINAPIVAWPLGALDCSHVSNGAAAAIICRANEANQYRKDPIYVKALQVVTAPGEKLEHRNHYRAHLDTTHRAAILAYEEAGISKPREEISMLETHDCCSISELLHYEDLMISPYGKAIDDLDSGFYDLDGKIPCQPDGGFKCFGDSIGASAIRMIYEIYKQLQGNVDSNRQVRNPRIGLAHHLSGNPFTSAVSITILSDEL